MRCILNNVSNRQDTHVVNIEWVKPVREIMEMLEMLRHTQSRRTMVVFSLPRLVAPGGAAQVNLFAIPIQHARYRSLSYRDSVSLREIIGHVYEGGN